MSQLNLRFFAAAISLTIFCYANYFYIKNDFAIYLACLFSLAWLAYFDRNERTTYPILFIFFLYQTFWTIVAYLFLGVSALAFLLFYGLNDLIFMIVLLKFYNNERLCNWFGVRGKVQHFTELQWIGGFIAVSSFYKFAALIEFIISKIDGEFFRGFVPFFFSTGQIATGILRVIIEVLLWTLAIKMLSNKDERKEF